MSMAPLGLLHNQRTQGHTESGMMTRALTGISCAMAFLSAVCAVADQPDDALRRLPAIGYGPSSGISVARRPEDIEDIRSVSSPESSDSNRRDTQFVLPVANTSPTVVVPGVMGFQPVRVEPFESADAQEAENVSPSSPIVVPLVDDPVKADLSEDTSAAPPALPQPPAASSEDASEGLPEPVVVDQPAALEESEPAIDVDLAPAPPVTPPVVTESLPSGVDNLAQPPAPITPEPFTVTPDTYADPLDPPLVFAPAEPPAPQQPATPGATVDAWSDESSETADDSKGAFGAFGAFGRWKTYWRTTLKPRMQSTHWGYAPLFYESPFGSQLEAHLSAQVHNGICDRMVLYQYDFFDGFSGPPEQLNSRGLEELDRIAGFMAGVDHPIVVERSGDGRLDEMRRMAVFDRLRQTGRGLADDCVVVGRPAATGLLRGSPVGQSSEAESNYQNMLNHANQRGGTSLGNSGD